MGSKYNFIFKIRNMSHRFYQANQTYLLMQHQENNNLAKRLKSIKPTIDNRQPKRFNHLNIKRSKSGKFRKREVDYQNKVLLSKMMGILKRRNNKSGYEMTMPPMGSLNFLQRK